MKTIKELRGVCRQKAQEYGIDSTEMMEVSVFLGAIFFELEALRQEVSRLHAKVAVHLNGDDDR